MIDGKGLPNETTIFAAGGELLSVDADAHLHKLASSMFPTPTQLPVELVRAALKRRAKKVALKIGRSLLLVEDDGEEIDAGHWRHLACALDARRAPADREQAISALQDAARPGIGLLAVLVPGAEEIRIESPGRENRPALQIRGGAVASPAATRVDRGTRIAIRRRNGAIDGEKKLLTELCAAVSAEVTLNGLRIEKKPVLRRALVQQEMDLGPGKGSFQVAIPARGDICRIWLLDQRIPWQLFTSASYRGLVFDAALESRQAATEREFAQLAAAAVRLYHWLAEHYPSFPPRYQERIEDLLFKKMGMSGDLRLVSSFAPFRLWRSHLRLSLEEVRRKADAGTLYALPLNASPGRFPYARQEALQLTPRQSDFLLNIAGVPLIPISATATNPGMRSRLAGAWMRFTRLLADRIPHRRTGTLDPASLDDEERRLCRELELIARGHAHPVAPSPLHVAMIPGRGLTHCIWRPMKSGDLLLRRGHPLVKAAVRSVARDRANAELAFTALLPPSFLTAGRR
jgi:hypothetical protein